MNLSKSLKICVIVSVFIFSCTKKPLDSNPPIPEPSKSTLQNIPFATKAELLQWSGDTCIIDYRISRILALMELNYSSGELSECPVVLYDFDSTPRYYEFILIDANKNPVGTLCTYARKEQPSVVAYILQEIRDYNQIGVKSFGLKTFALSYPQQLLYGMPTRSGETPNSLMDTQGHFKMETPPVQHTLDPLAQIDELGVEYFQAMGLENIQEQRTSIEQALQAEQQDAKEYWAQIALIGTDLLLQEQAGWIKTKGSVNRIDEFILPQYDTQAMQKTRWQGGCGPSVLAYIYRGLYDSYKGVYLPIWGDPGFMDSEQRPEGRLLTNDRAVYFYQDDSGDHDGDEDRNLVDREWITERSARIDNSLYADIADYGWYYNFSKIVPSRRWGAALPIHLTLSMERITDNAYTVGILPKLAPHQHIRKNKLSVLLLSGTFTHFLHAYGSREQIWKWETVFKIFGKEVSLSTPEIVTHRWFKVNDNGTNTGKHDFLPFWMDDCITNSILKFGVYKNK